MTNHSKVQKMLEAHVAREEQVEAIAAKHLGIEGLDVAGSDSLDFHEVGVGSLQAALIAAYEAGKASN